MKRNLKLLSGILMASFISNSAVNNINMQEAKSRSSRPIVVNGNEPTVNEKEDISKLSSSSLKDVDKSSEMDDYKRNPDESENTSNKPTKGSSTSSNTNKDSSKTSSSSSSSSSNKSGSSSKNDKTNSSDDTTDTSDEETSDESTSSSSQTSNIMDILNADDTLTIDDIAQLALSISNSEDFVKEFEETFPKMNPLRKLSPIETKNTTYLNVNDKEIDSINTFLKKNPDLPLSYAEQNTCSGLLKSVETSLNDLTKSISEEYNSTIFSLMPSILIFNDTFEILSSKYKAVLESNYNNHITLDIMLKDIENQLENLLGAMNEFKQQLPDLIKTLNKLAESSSSNSSNSSSDESDVSSDESDVSSDESNVSSDESNVSSDESDASSDESDVSSDVSSDESLDESLEESTSSSSSSSTGSSSSSSSNSSTSSSSAGSSSSNSNTSSSNNSNESTSSGNNQQTESSSTSTEEETPNSSDEIDPTQVNIYLGENNQELVYDEETDKYYEINPEDPNGEELIEYSGEVTTMTLADYLAIELYFDAEGNELVYDEETDGYLLYNPDTDEFTPYEGEVTTITMGEYLDELANAGETQE